MLVGYYDGSSLLIVANIRAGLTPNVKAEVAGRFTGLESDRCPFANLPEPKHARRGLALTADAMKECRWLKPQLVAQVEFTEWTSNGHLRHARFVALREDKDPREVTRESADPVKGLAIRFSSSPSEASAGAERVSGVESAAPERRQRARRRFRAASSRAHRRRRQGG